MASAPTGQKQPPEVICEIRCSQKLRNIHRKTLVLSLSLIKSEGLHFYLKRLQQRYFPVNTAKLVRTPIWENICKRLLLAGVDSSFYNQTSFKRQFIRYSYLKKTLTVCNDLMMKVFSFSFFVVCPYIFTMILHLLFVFF